MNLTNCPLCGQPAFDLHLTADGRCEECRKALAAHSAIRDVAGLWNRAIFIEDEITVAYDVIAGFVPNHHRSLMGSVTDHAQAHADALRRQADAIMREHGITEDDMNAHYGSEAEKAVAHYDPTPMLPSMRSIG
jgi:hypothetical protein